MTTFKICSCNRTMPLDAAAAAQIGAALNTGPLPVASELCRHEVNTFLKAMDGVDDVVVACTQERSLFAELAHQKQSVAPLRFVNIRETGGWSAQARQSTPKMAALLAAAALPQPEPVPVVNYESHGHVLIIGSAKDALPWAERLATQQDVSVLLTDGGAPGTHSMLEERSFPVFSGSRVTLSGWLGKFDVRWQQTNPIDLETCTRCTACLDACPEGAIDLTYQVNLELCKSHRACVSACASIGAIDFMRQATERSGSFDLIFDLSPQPLMSMHQLPQGYFAPGTDPIRQAGSALEMTQLIGQFEKPKFFQYKEKLCAHSRSGKLGCNACVDVCSAEAIRHDGDHIKVVPNLCAGCGACTTVCPSGALSYAYPRAPDMGLRIKTVLNTYAKAGGLKPALLIHGAERGAQILGQTGRLARGGGRGLPAHVIPIEAHHAVSIGIDLWLAAVAYGAVNIAVMVTEKEAPQYASALEQQMAIAQAILEGMGYDGTYFHLLRVRDASELETALHAMQAGQGVPQAATFHTAADKRGTLTFAIDHLYKHAPAKVAEIALPAGAPYGTVHVDQDRCTLCMACVGACPVSALADNADRPQLRFVEANCVQCGLCQKTCPESAITLTPRLLLADTARQSRTLNEAQPFHCIRCSKPFGTAQMIENMLGKLVAHGAFSGNLDRLKMCADCRVVDMMENPNEAKVTELKRTT